MTFDRRGLAMGVRSFSWHEPGRDGVLEIPCPHCRAILDLHMPDPQIPDRMLGTCGECQRWYLVDSRTFRMTLIPLVE